jgi:hypothetical protein
LCEDVVSTTITDMSTVCRGRRRRRWDLPVRSSPCEAVKDAQLGQVIEVVATDAGILADAPAWAHRTGHMIIGAYSDDGRHRFWFRKAHE